LNDNVSTNTITGADDTEEDTAVPDAPREDTLLAGHKLLLKHLALTAQNCIDRRLNHWWLDAEDTEADVAVPDVPQEDTLQVAHKLLLKHLALTALADDSIAATATGFRLCRALFDEVATAHDCAG